MTINAERIDNRSYILRIYDNDPEIEFNKKSRYRGVCCLCVNKYHGEIKGALTREGKGFCKQDILDLMDLCKLLNLKYILIEREGKRKMPLAELVHTNGGKKWRIDL